jgi:hypothetical protein
VTNQKIADLGDGLEVWMVAGTSLREQTINPQIMRPRDFDRLVENIRARGGLESLPYCYLPADEPDAVIEIVSGHHRCRAAHAAGLERFPVIVDRHSMTRSELAAKQIAHNHLVGSPDSAVLRELLQAITDADDLLATGLPEEMLPIPAPSDPVPLAHPTASFDFRTVTLTFLPHQLANFKEVADVLEASDMVGVAHVDCYQEFARAMASYSRLKEIRAVGTTIHVLTTLARQEIAELEENGDGDDAWVPIERALETHRIPQAAAAVVKQAIVKARERGDVTDRNAWQLLEWWAANYLAES